MESLDRELTLEIPHNMNFVDTSATGFFQTVTDSSAKAAVQLLDSTPKTAILTSPDYQIQHLHLQQRLSPIGNQFLQKLGETLFGFGGHSVAARPGIGVSSSDLTSGSNMDLLRNHIVIDSGGFDAVEKSDLQQQLEYDKFMNEIWIGIVLTLIIISMVFCICSCFLYHQFRQWKRNYRSNLQHSQDIESVKLNPDTDDPVPEYTLVSGLPSYEAALELMQKTATDSGSCLIVYPSLFNVFSVNEKDPLSTQTALQSTQPQLPQIHGDATQATTTTIPTMTRSQNVKCQSVPRLALHSIPSYEEATTCTPHNNQLLQQQYQIQARDSSTCLMKSSAWCDDHTSTTKMVKKN